VETFMTSTSRRLLATVLATAPDGFCGGNGKLDVE
jgi:hypothetical protein